MKKKIILISLIALLLYVSAASAADNSKIKMPKDSISTKKVKHIELKDKKVKKSKTKNTDKKAVKKQKKTKKQNNENKITTINDYKTYEEFKQTVESSKDGDTVKLTENIKSQDTINVKANNLIIDGQGFTIDGDNHRIFDITGNNTIIQNLKFINGKSDNGGAIYVEANQCSMKKCEFNNNNADNNGGAVYCEGKLNCTDCIFKNNHISKKSVTYGGAICSKNSVTIDKCTFENNEGYNGGSIYIGEGNSTIKNSQFKNNNVNHYGAGICTEDNLFVQNCTFIKNEAIAAGGTAGGAIYSKKRVSVNSSTFEDNEASGAFIFDCIGGAIYCGNIDCNSTTFKENYAWDQGGAIYINSFGNSTIKNSIFIKNKNEYYGGAIYLASVTSHISLIHNIFTENYVRGKLRSIAYTKGYFDEISKNYFYSEKPNWSSHLLCREGTTTVIDCEDSNYARTMEEYNNMGPA